MKTPTKYSNLLMIGLEPAAELVTFFDYVESRRTALATNPAAEMRTVYQIARQLVLDNPFSLEAKLSFPIVHHDYSLQNLCVWAERFVNTWFADLSKREQRLFRSIEFIPSVPSRTEKQLASPSKPNESKSF